MDLAGVGHEHSMLILTRRLGESVKLDDEVTVPVLGVKGPQVRLGFAAPTHVAVHRDERVNTAPSRTFPRAKSPASADDCNRSATVLHYSLAAHCHLQNLPGVLT